MTKQKYKLSKKAEQYLKAQGGLQVPYEYPYQDNTSPFDLGQIDPSLQTAQQNQIVQAPSSAVPVQANQKSNVLGSLSKLGSLGAGIKMGTGLISLFQSFGEKKKAKRIELNAKRDLENRMKESRENDFYYTGQSSGSYSDFNKKGGQVMQQGGFMDFYNQKEQQNKQTQNIWNDYYNEYVEQQKQKANNLQQEGLSNIISGATDQLSMAASVLTGGVMKRGGILSKALKYQNGGLNLDTLKTNPMIQNNVQTSISDLTPEHLSLLKPQTKTSDSIKSERASYIWNYKKENPEMFDMLMGLNPDRPHAVRSKRFYKSDRMKQDGGSIGVEQEVNEDLYSADFQSPVQNNQQDAQSYFTEIMNKYQALDPQGSLENKAMSWIFEEEQEPKRYNISDVFQNQGTVPPKGDIATSHNNPGNIKYGQFAQKYGATVGRGATDGGKFAYFPSVEAGLQAQKDLLTSGGYANLTVSDAMKRWSNSGYGADLYPEVANKKMKDLTPQELNELVLRQTKRESPTIYNKIYGQ